MEAAIITNSAALRELVEDSIQLALSRAAKPPPPIMTKAQVADYLGKSISTVNRYMKEGLPFRKVENDYPEFYKKDIDRWLEERFSAAQETEGIQ